jgi:predicted esterase
MPEEGYPIVLYAHGTGGDYRSYADGDYAKTMADKCVAMMGVDQIFHGTRPGAPADETEGSLLFFNFQNVDAARTNGRQSAIDEVQRARLFTEARATIPANVSLTGTEIRFDPSKVLFFGHSQGGLNGPLYLALDDSARGGVLSGSGTVIQITLLEKTAPPPSIADLVATVFLALLPEEREELDLFHPALMVAQSLTDAIDPINYAHLTVREPLPGQRPKSILMTEGIAPDGSGDSYTPPKGTEAQAIAMGLPLQLPATRPYPQLAYGAPPAIEIPAAGLSGNLAGGAASGVLAQWAPGEDDGHFVVFEIAAARAQVAEFLRRLADDPAGSVPRP